MKGAYQQNRIKVPSNHSCSWKRKERGPSREGHEQMKKRENSMKSDATPSVALESVLYIPTTDASEKREGDTVDIPGAYLNEEVCMCLLGKLAELMVKSGARDI
jgi:hypothetical protein